MTETKVSLKDYAKAHPPRGRCRVCLLDALSSSKEFEGKPLREEIDAAFLAGTSIPIILRWLEEEHPREDVTDSNLRHHFMRGRHHVPKK